MSDEVETILAAVSMRMDTLHEEAGRLVDEHWTYYMDESKKRQDFAEKSMIYPRLRKTKVGFAIEWYRVLKWFKNHKGQWKKKTRYVSRGKTSRVNLNRYAQPWELETVNEFENRAELIRKEVTLLSNLIAAYKRLEKKGVEHEASHED